MTLRRPPLKRLALWAVGAVLFALAGALVFAWSGLYSVAASSGHYNITAWFLELAMRSSVRTHSLGTPEAPDLSDEDRIKLGASAYQANCAICHGAPDFSPSPVVQYMVPPPPLLIGKVSEWDEDELFWIVKHGIKYAGMPAWVSQERDDEVWSVVAFLRRLPDLDAEAYEKLAEGHVTHNDIQASTLTNFGTGKTALAVCARCHGDENNAPESSLSPKLAGQNRAYLEMALRDYRSGERPSGIMQPVAWELNDGHISKLAQYYSELPLQLHAADETATEDQIERGGRIVSQGLPEKGVPACAVCHLGGAKEEYPILTGQYPDYIEQQLELWRSGVRGQTATSKIMAPIAERLDPQDISDVAAYFGSLGVKSQNSTSTE